MNIILGILLIIGYFVMVLIIGAVKVLEWIGKQSASLYNQHPYITIAAITALVGYEFLSFIATTWSV